MFIQEGKHLENFTEILTYLEKNVGKLANDIDFWRDFILALKMLEGTKAAGERLITMRTEYVEEFKEENFAAKRLDDALGKYYSAIASTYTVDPNLTARFNQVQASLKKVANPDQNSKAEQVTKTTSDSLVLKMTENNLENLKQLSNYLRANPTEWAKNRHFVTAFSEALVKLKTSSNSMMVGAKIENLETKFQKFLEFVFNDDDASKTLNKSMANYFNDYYENIKALYPKEAGDLEKQVDMIVRNLQSASPVIQNAGNPSKVPPSTYSAHQ